MERILEKRCCLSSQRKGGNISDRVRPHPARIGMGMCRVQSFLPSQGVSAASHSFWVGLCMHTGPELFLIFAPACLSLPTTRHACDRQFPNRTFWEKEKL